MFGFGWVRTHSGVVFGDAFGLCWGFWLDLWKKDEISKYGKFLGLMSRRKDPTQ